MKDIVIRLKKAGNRTSVFSISDGLGHTLVEEASKTQLIQGIALSVEDYVTAIVISSTGINCCALSLTIPITTITNQELVNLQFDNVNTSSLWRHLTNPILYNDFYGCIAPYVIEYPFAYQFQDEILQNVKDYTKTYTYLPSINGVFDDNQKIETDDSYFNKAVIYNGQQSSGVLELVNKPMNNLKLYMTFPKFNTNSKTITFTKSDNFYQYNTFWDVVKSKSIPLFLTSCESMSIDKEVNQENMNYTSRSFNKFPFRAKDAKIRHILDNRNDLHLVSQFLSAPAQLSYK